MSAPPRTGLVAIGRNEGERLKRCLRSVPPGVPVVYVDSGSSDDSVAFAQGLGVAVEILSTTRAFTAARARNVGWNRLLRDHPGIEFVQFIDGDCEMNAHWLPSALEAIEVHPEVCALFGRLRERHPDASLYNALCDDEWNAPLGYVNACGGIALFRVEALRQAHGFNDAIIAGEEPDLCLRLRRSGWKVLRIDAEMALHDAAITKAQQWWKRLRRGGYAYAEHVVRHGRSADPAWRRNRNSILVWGLVLPLVIMTLGLSAVISWQVLPALLALGLIGLYLLQWVRLSLRKRRQGFGWRFSMFHGVWLVIGKFAQCLGIWQFYRKRHTTKGARLFDYK